MGAIISLNSCLCARQGGRDQPFLGELFAQLAAGRFGNLAPDRVAACGWSGGPHMVSGCCRRRRVARADTVILAEDDSNGSKITV